MITIQPYNIMVTQCQPVEENAGKRAANNNDASSSSDNENGHIHKKVKHEDRQTSNHDNNKPGKGKGGWKNKEPTSKAREIRLEENRKAARESRRRKKVLQEELQRSVIFFSRANGTLKQQHEELKQMLAQARTQVSAIESGQGGGGMLQQQQQQPAGGDSKDPRQNQFQGGQAPQLNNYASVAPAQGGGQQDMGQFYAPQAGQSQQQQNGNNQAPGSMFDPNNTGAQSAPAPVADSNNTMNWVNFLAASMGEGAPGFDSMGFDPNRSSPYAQALGQFAMQQQAQSPAINSNGSSTPNPGFQFPFGQNPDAGMLPMQFATGANPFLFSQFCAAPNAGAAGQAAGIYNW